MKTSNRTKTLWYVALPILIVVACVLQPQARAQMTSTGIDCSQIGALRLLMQDNMRAGLALIECGVVQGGRPTGSGDAVTGDEPSPPNILVSNRTCSGPTSCTHSESMVFASPKAGDHTVVVNYNDHNAGQYSGTSYSTDGGSTFTEILPPPFASGHNTNFGDPIVIFNSKLNLWFAGDLVTGCGGQGIGLWKSTDGQTWTVASCAHNNSGDDRESMWVDNSPYSSAYGRMYISWNDFNVGGGALFVTHSDDGITWSTPVQVANGSPFIRDVQITGTLPGQIPPSATWKSPVFLEGMDEGSGGLTTRQNVIYRSTDGGVTWTSATQGPRFNPVGDSTCGYFAKVNPIWRHMGWGEPAVGPNGVVHYAYAGKGTVSGDNGDIFYVRSTDNGLTWSAPIKLNDDSGGSFKTQWMPSVSVNYSPTSPLPQAKVTVSWYDRRAATSACNAVTDPGCSYERYGIQSADNGATWGANFAISDGLIAEPDQQDSGVQGCYAGDYDYSTALGNSAYVTWTDGRVSIGGVHVQNVEFAKVPEP
jgi:hypothetical protein